MDYRAHAFYSDDHGATFKLSNSIDIPSSNESIAVELSNGDVMQNIRQQSGEERKRLIALSTDSGETWNTTYFDSTLITPVCQASIIAHKLSNKKNVLLFSNPESIDSRVNMTVKMSYDDGTSWPIKRTIRSGEAAYSDLVIQEDSNIGLLYEHGNDGGIHYASFNISWLLGADNLKLVGAYDRIFRSISFTLTSPANWSLCLSVSTRGYCKI